MKTIVQGYRESRPRVLELPPPALRPEGILVRNAVSLISAGTERLMIDLARRSLLGKARERPDLVRRVVEKVKRDGVISTLETVKDRLDAQNPLGYSSAGTVIEVGAGVGSFRIGDRVACAGAGYASHAEVVYVPKHLAVPIPPGIELEAAAFTTVGAIALQGLRLAEVELGETVAVIGFGLVGLLAAQLARAAGCRVMGMDPDAERCQLARQLGVEVALSESSELVACCREQTGGHGADKVLVTASTKSSEPVEVAGELARERGVVIVVGAVGMEIPRKPFYDKELSFRVSRSYGPGRYDPEYEEKGRDYPFGYVRWTENRNMQAFVEQLAQKRVDVGPLVSHRFGIEDAAGAYDLLTGKQKEPYLAILLTYPEVDPVDAARERRLEIRRELPATSEERAPACIGVLGAGQFATGVLLPALARIPGVELAGVCTATGVTAEHVGRKFGFRFATTSEAEILEDPRLDTVLIATRHHLHADQVIAALDAGKNVFVEKPLCLTEEELKAIEKAYASAEARRDRSPLLMVGYNRRFAPMSQRLKAFLAEIEEPLVMHYRVNAGPLPANHWVQDPEQGGGRIVGEVCHFIDYLTFLAGSAPRRITATATPNAGRYHDDNLVATMELADGSLATVTYTANGDTALAKERLEVFGGAAAAVLDNFRRLELVRGGRSQVERSRLRQDKGHRAQLEAFVEAVRTGATAPIPLGEIIGVTHATFAVARCLREASTIEL